MERKQTTLIGPIAYQTGRPERDRVIANDEIMNLVIMLHTTQDVGEFLRRCD